MSIIHDALKKVQQNMQGEKKEEVEVLSAAPPTQPEEKKQPTPWLLIILSSIVIGGSVVYIFTQIQNKYPRFLSEILPKLSVISKQTVQKVEPTQATKPTAHLEPVQAINKTIESAKSLKPMKTLNPLKYIHLPKSLPPTSKPLAQVTIPQTEGIEKNPPIVINVQGIMADAKGNLALIDNEIYEEGSTIHGIKILKINIDEIIIELNGKQETVPVRK